MHEIVHITGPFLLPGWLVPVLLRLLSCSSSVPPKTQKYTGKVHFAQTDKRTDRLRGVNVLDLAYDGPVVVLPPPEGCGLNQGSNIQVPVEAVDRAGLQVHQRCAG